jgi:hypothetical protein
MSLLNRPSDGTHSVLIVIYKLILEEGAMPRDKIIGLCTPPPLSKGTMVGATLNTWIEFGLFEELNGGNVTLGKSISKSDHTLENLPWLARRLVLQEDNNPDLWSNEKAKASDFTRAVAWLLAQDVYTVSLAGWTVAEDLLMKQVPASLRANKEHGLIQNDTRWTGLKAWSVWLGFTWLGRHPKDVLTIDPTQAVADALPTVFGRKQSMPASEVVAALAEALPVLDGGAYRKKVEAKLAEQSGADAWRPPPDEQISTSLSRAFLRLKESGTLVSDLKSDAKDRILLTGREQRIAEQVSHFTFKP